VGGSCGLGRFEDELDLLPTAPGSDPGGAGFFPRSGEWGFDLMGDSLCKPVGTAYACSPALRRGGATWSVEQLVESAVSLSDGSGFVIEPLARLRECSVCPARVFAVRRRFAYLRFPSGFFFLDDPLSQVPANGTGLPLGLGRVPAADASKKNLRCPWYRRVRTTCLSASRNRGCDFRRGEVATRRKRGRFEGKVTAGVAVTGPIPDAVRLVESEWLETGKRRALWADAPAVVTIQPHNGDDSRASMGNSGREFVAW